MEIKLQEKENKGTVFIGEESDPQAEMMFTKESETLVNVRHTEVDDKLQGQSIGRQLLDHLAEKARQENFKIMADCPYVKHVFKKYSDYEDVKN